MMTKNRVEKFWVAYRDQMYGKVPLTPTQERECSRSFYAGMVMAMLEMSYISATVLDVDKGAEELDNLRKEIELAAMRVNLDRSDGLS